MLVFDAVLWGGKDTGDNRQFMKEAEILDRYLQREGYGELATVRFLHDGRVSRGHFVDCMEPVVTSRERANG
jgi:hypothetical protein